MTPLESFHAVAGLVRDPVALLDSAGTIVRYNGAFARLLDDAGRQLEGTPLAAHCHEPEEHVRSAILTWRRATAPTPARLTLRRESENAPCRVLGGLYSAADPSRHVIISVVAAGHDAFLLLGQKIEELTAEVQRRKAAETAARAAANRVESLRQLGDALAGTLTRDEAADVIIAEGRKALAADTCTIHTIDEPRRALTLLAEGGCAPEVVAQIRRIDLTTSTVAVTCATTGEPAWVESLEEYARLMPALASMRATGPRAKAFWCVPLSVEGETIGVLGMGYYAERVFSPGEREFVTAFARQCAAALRRAERIERERSARDLAERAQQWLKTTLTSIGDAVIATDTTGAITFMNPVAEALTGYSQDEARQRSLREVFRIVDERTRQEVPSPVEKVLRDGVVVGLANHTILLGKHAEIPIDDSAAPIRDAGGHVHGVVLVFRDVTEKKRTELHRAFLAEASGILAESLEYTATLQQVAELAVPRLADWCAVDIADDDGRVGQQIAVAHVDPSKVALATRLRETYPPDPDAPTGVPRVIRTGRPEFHPEISEEALASTAKDAEHLQIVRDLKLRSAIVVPLTARGRVLGALSLVYAESGRRYSEDDLAFAEDFAARAGLAITNARLYAAEQRAHQQAEQANTAKDEFLATVSHELRTPLNAILGWARLMTTQTMDDEKRMRASTIVERNAVAMAQLIEDLLDVSRIVTGKMRLDVRPVDLAPVIEAAVDAVRPAAEAKGITVVSILDATAGPVTGDATRLQQVAWNLLSNAVKFTPKGGRVEVLLRVAESNVEVVVTDSGSGIDPAFLPHVFEPFRQADGTITRAHGGLGLGLAIARHLVQIHGGEIRADSEGRGRGARFTVVLPVAISWQPARNVTPAEMRRTAEADAVDTDNLAGVTVLVVDDDPEARTLAHAVLDACGCRVILAASAAEAFEKIASERPDVLVSDVSMPGETGLDLIHKVRSLADPELRMIPAAALTAYAGAEHRRRVLRAGYLLHVAKPVEPAELVAVVANLGRFRKW
jgi:PAS domain S-box-containing protein